MSDAFRAIRDLRGDRLQACRRRTLVDAGRPRFNRIDGLDYTVQIDTDGAGQSAVVPCASGSSNFFMLTSPVKFPLRSCKSALRFSKLRVAK